MRPISRAYGDQMRKKKLGELFRSSRKWAFVRDQLAKNRRRISKYQIHELKVSMMRKVKYPIKELVVINCDEITAEGSCS